MKNSPFGRDPEVEQAGREQDALNASDSYIRGKAQSVGIGPNYFAVKIAELDKATLKVANEVTRLMQDNQYTYAKVTNDLLAERLKNAQSKFDAKVVNGVSEALVRSNADYIGSLLGS